MDELSPHSRTANNATSLEKGLFDKVFDMTGEAIEKFGNFFRG